MVSIASAEGLQSHASQPDTCLMAKKSRDDDPNAKEETDTAGHGGALFRDTALGSIIRLVTRNRFHQYPEERNPEYYIQKYGKKAQQEKKQKVEDENRRSEEAWREANPRDAALEDRNASPSNTLAGSPDRERSADGKRSTSNENGPDESREKPIHHDEERGKDVNLVGFEPNDPGKICKI